jgi:hypothetical protein
VCIRILKNRLRLGTASLQDTMMLKHLEILREEIEEDDDGEASEGSVSTVASRPLL